jgi:pyruvate dehydrogenase E1 component alpha subunit
MLNTSITERVRGGWSLPCEEVDGTDAISTFSAVRAAVERARAGEGPQVVEAVTLRMEGHAAHDAGVYMDQSLKEQYAAQRDPVERLAARLLLSGLSPAGVDRLRAAAVDEVAAGLAEAERSPAPDPATLEDGVYSQPV